MKKELKYALTNLMPGTKYYLRMFAKNQIGQSNKTNITSADIEDDDFKSTFAYGYCWIIMGSIVGGIVLLCVCSHIFCCLKRAKTMSENLHITAVDNYDNIGTLNYNNVIFDHIANGAEMNNDNVSSIIESNDIVLRADWVSSDDSSSIKLYDIGMFVSILKISAIFTLYCYSAGAAVYKRTYTSIFVETDETVVLNCTCFLQSESAWSGPKRSAMKEMGDNDTEEPYTEGLLLNPGLFNMNIDIIGNYDIGECNLVIRNFSAVDVGNYKCEYLISGIVCIHIITAYLKSPPTNLTFLNTMKIRDKKVIRGIDGQALDIICNVKSGKPLETLLLTKNGSIVQSNASGEIEYSFIPSRNDNLKSFECSAFSEMLESPLTDEAILDIRYKPSLTVYNPALGQVVENISIDVCCKGNSNPPLDEIAWTGNIKSLVAKDNESCITFNPILRTHTGRYTCVASNSIGKSSTHIDIKVKYPPIVSVSYQIKGQTTYLHCHPNGEPKHYTFAKWLHRSEINETIRHIQGTRNGKISIIAQSKNKLHENDGIYVCRVTNGIKDKNGMLYKEGVVFVQREAPPIFISTNRRVQLGQYGCELNITAFLYSKPENIQLNISNQNKILQPRITHERVRAHDLFYSVNVTVSAIKLVFHLGLASKNDFANYSIEACNPKGCNTFTVDIRSTNHPEPPVHVSAVLNSTSLVVYWQPGFDGGQPQSFYIEYRPETKSEWEVLGSIAQSNFTMDQELKYTLNYILFSKKYYLRMYAANVVGRSNYSNLFCVEMKGCHCNFGKYHYTVWGVISSLLGGILILSICLNIYCLLRRKNNSEIVFESPPEGQYYEIGPINNSSASIQGELNNIQEAVTSVERSASQSTNSLIYSFQKESSLESSVQSLSNKLPNEDGYENPYQTIDRENIEMHLYSIVTSQMYQNTIIFPKEITAEKTKKAFQNDKERSPWLIIYKNKRVIA
ncbi:unnamed protein product [Mytilus coruscus]|uniref:Uncharacterized protein n=1 Tax=Mytilus coruscus TaxID=42192 RepID=A0A6J8CA46_MYTCO|nr:unnamed protein product [Mytilus coruscus]